MKRNCLTMALLASVGTLGTAPAIMIGEKTSDLVRGREPLPPAFPEDG